MRKMTEGNCTIIYWPTDAEVAKKSSAPLGVSVEADLAGAHTDVGSSLGDEAGGGNAVGVEVRMMLGRQGVNVVPFDTRLADRWDRAVAGIGGVPGVTDDQLRDVFLLMVAEMSGMVASKGGRGENTNEA